MLLSVSLLGTAMLLSMLSCERAGLGLLLEDVFLSVPPRLPKLDLGVEVPDLAAVA